MAQVIPKTVAESLYWSYANLAMATAFYRHNEPTYQQNDYIVRNKTYCGLLKGKLKLGSFFKNERTKLHSGPKCSYCGSTEKLSLDHLIPKLRDGPDAADNLVAACRSCNSSKAACDLLEWFGKHNKFPSGVLLSRYLKLAIRFCVAKNLMDILLADIQPGDERFPFAIHLVPHEYPDPARDQPE